MTNDLHISVLDLGLGKSESECDIYQRLVYVAEFFEGMLAKQFVIGFGVILSFQLVFDRFRQFGRFFECLERSLFPFRNLLTIESQSDGKMNFLFSGIQIYAVFFRVIPTHNKPPSFFSILDFRKWLLKSARLSGLLKYNVAIPANGIMTFVIHSRASRYNSILFFMFCSLKVKAKAACVKCGLSLEIIWYCFVSYIQQSSNLSPETLSLELSFRCGRERRFRRFLAASK
nr:MAG TPA: hypothetical protein [Caudoviricetes sp.]